MLKTKNLLIVRHGQTDYNKKGMVQGSGIDASLNDTGRKQAKKFYKAYKDYGFDKLYISELKRTYESAEPFIKDGLEYEKLVGLNEISWGEKEGQPFSQNTHSEYKDMIQAWQNGELDHKIKKGESPLEVMTRQKQAMDVIMSNEKEENVLILMHGRAMRILVCWLLNHDLKYMDMFTHENLCLYHITYNKAGFQAKLLDDRSHLS